MMHPETELRFVSSVIGFGVFAKSPIPKGTLTYVQDPLDVVIDPRKYESLEANLKQQVDRFAFIDPAGDRVLCWDHAKYVNHSCEANSMSTGYGFEIALRDIAAGEEITDEYGLFNLSEAFPLSCGCPNCRHMLRPEDIDRFHDVWDAQIIDALGVFRKHPQSLAPYIESETLADLESYLAGERPYRPILSTKLAPV